MKTDYECAEIIDDSDEEYILLPKPESKTKTRKPKAPEPVLKKCYNKDDSVYEIGVDEVGRGPLFGRVYTAAVILPKDDSFDCSKVKDSKKFHSKKKIEEAAKYIKEHALAWYISFEDEKTIDDINILQEYLGYFPTDKNDFLKYESDINNFAQIILEYYSRKHITKIDKNVPFLFLTIIYNIIIKSFCCIYFIII